MKEIIICSGVPCSGKSTWTQGLKSLHIKSVCRDDIRQYSWEFDQPYRYSKRNEDRVTDLFNKELNHWLEFDHVRKIILDNTFCKEHYIDEIIRKYPKQSIKIKFFDISLYKAHYRNVFRYLRTGKWIPVSVINQMMKNYNKINKEKYKQYLL